MKGPLSQVGFYGIFSGGHLLLSKRTGMAFLFDTKREAELQMHELRLNWPKTPMKVVMCAIYIPEGL